MKSRTILLTVLALTQVAFGQSWSEAYQRGLDQLHARRFSAARVEFKKAAALRTEDFSDATLLPGSVTDPKKWRNGLPYSPNFAAAYACYKQSIESADDLERSSGLRTAAGEFQLLLAKKQLSRESVYFLSTIYSILRDLNAQSELESRLASTTLAWRVDPDILTPEEHAAIDNVAFERGPLAGIAPTPPVAIEPPVTKPVVQPEKTVTKSKRDDMVVRDVEPNSSKNAKPKPKTPDQTDRVAHVEPAKPIVVQNGETVALKTKSTSAKSAKTEKAAPTKSVKKAQDNPAKDAPAKKQDNPTKDAPKKQDPKPTKNPAMDQPADANPPQQRNPVTDPGPNNPKKGVRIKTPTSTAPATDPLKVEPVPTKFALIIGNGEGRVANATPAFGAADAQLIREKLLQNCGYIETNIDMVVNASAEQMRKSAQALADRLTADATVFIYFAGAGTNIDGSDWLMGVDTELTTDTSTMIAKAEIYKMFMAKGARIFAFYQANRPIVAGRYFGMEVPLVGAISQMQATIPGSNVNSVVVNGQNLGLFSYAVGAALMDFHSNKIPILEFAWQVFDKIRGADSGTQPGGSIQVPTLPVITNMASDARF